MTADIVLEKARIVYDVFREQKRNCFVMAIFLDEDRDTHAVVCNLDDIADTRAQIEQLLEDRARPICIQVLPIGQPMFYPIGDSLTVDDQAIIDAGFDKEGPGGLGYRLIVGYKPPDQGEL